MVRIRLRRMGARNQPSYRIVVADQRSPRDGRFIESGRSLVQERWHLRSVEALPRRDTAGRTLPCGSNPEEVRVTSEKRGRRVRITLSVAPDDMGRVIGRQGRVAEAIRNVVHVVAQKRGLFVDVDIR